MFTCRMGSGTRYLQVILTTSMAVASDTRWPIETNMGFNELCVDLTACRKLVENSLQTSCNNGRNLEKTKEVERDLGNLFETDSLCN